jgi:hypothetical protein
MASITKNQVSFLKTKFLNELGEQKATDNLPVVEGILQEYAKAFLKTAIDNLEKSGSVASGLTSTDITFAISQVSGSYIISIGYPKGSKASKYYDFINKGVAGVGKTTDSPYAFKSKYPSQEHVSAIKSWLKFGKAKIMATDVSRYGPTKNERKSSGLRKKDITKSLAYMIASSVKRKGIRATHFFDDAIKTTFDKNFIGILSEALAADVSLQIIQTTREN